MLDARFTKAKQTQQSTPSAKEKVGNIATCPNCGTQIPGGAAKCPSCGYEFRNGIANRSIERFNEGLQSLNDKMIGSLKSVREDDRRSVERANAKKIGLYISTFPVPNTADDLLEFLSLAQGQARKHKLDDQADAAEIQEHAYWGLFGNCISKAKINFANDPRFIPYFEYYKKQNKKMTPETKVFVGVLCGLLMFIAIPVIISFICS